MLKSLIKALLIVASLIWSGMVCAVGFGSANVTSALGQPLIAEISLIEVGKADRSGLTARMATPEAYKAAGLDYPYHLSKLKFEIGTRNGESYIRVTSKDAVNDPFVTMLVELNWSSGRLLHEFTFLLDPPDYKAEQPKAEEVTPIEPVVATVPPSEAPQVEPIVAAVPASAPEATEAVSAPVAATAGTVASSASAASAPVAAEPGLAAEPESSASEAATSAPVPASVPASKAVIASTNTEKAESRESIAVKRGDTLSKIAAQVQEPDVTLEQMLVALYRANANKFDGKNMNRIRAGKVLDMPDPDVLSKLTQAAAVREIRIQTANWNAYKQKLAAVSAPVPEQAPKQEASGKINTSVSDKTPAVKDAAKEVLKLSKGEAPGDKTAVGGKAQAQEAQAHAKEEAIAKENAERENKTRTAMLEKNVKDMQKLVELKGGTPVASSTPVVSSSAVQAAKPAKPKMVPVAVAPEPSVLDDVLDNPMLKDPVYLGIGAAVLLGLGGLGFYLMRRGKGDGGRSPKKKSLTEKTGWMEKLGLKKLMKK